MTPAPLRVGLLGGSGRMGLWVRKVLQKPEYTGRAVLFASPSRHESLEPLLECDVVIDFSSPEAMESLARLALQSPRQPSALPAFIVGSTGWGPNRDLLDGLASRAWVLASSNFSIGVLAFLRVLEDTSTLLKKLGYTPVISESHHRHKKDAPSGTAKMMQARIEAEHPETIQTHSIRAGEVIGKHTATFYGTADEISLTHEALDRSLFARGAVDLALWLAQERLTGTHTGQLVPPENFLDHMLGEKRV